jgi:MurNAc alpha-1-phosphate uridylyltransferase
MFPVAILAGGFGTRLRPITEQIPKALVQVAGKPFVIHQLEYLKTQNVTDVVFCIGHLGQMIIDLLGDGSDLGMTIEYSKDGDIPLGTGGAIKKGAQILGDDFFILYGDSYLPVNFPAVQERYKLDNNKALMTVYKNKNNFDKSNVLFVDGKLIEYNKKEPRDDMRHIDYGLSAISSELLDEYQENECFDLSELFHKVSLRGGLNGYEVYDRFYEIGSYDGLIETEKFLRR